MSSIPITHEDYAVAWICALPLEAAAAKAMLDKTHPYTLGGISGHNTVVVCLPSGVYGPISAATVVAHMRTIRDDGRRQKNWECKW
jgi:hypothetical protein